MKKVIIFVIVWALLIVGGRFAAFRILDQKSTEAFDSLHQFSTMLGMPVKITYGKVFVDLANGPRKSDPLAVAEQSGWTAYGVADTSAFTTVETLRLLVGQNVPYSFVRLASGRGLY